MDEKTIEEALQLATFDQIFEAITERSMAYVFLAKRESPDDEAVGGVFYTNFLCGSQDERIGLARMLLARVTEDEKRWRAGVDEDGNTGDEE